MEIDDELSVFKPMLEELRRQICESAVKSEVDLEQAISLILTIGVDQFDVDDVNSTLNVVLKFVKENTQKFPSLVLLEYVKKCLEHISESDKSKEQSMQSISLSWPSDLKVVIRRLFQTFKIAEEYTVCCYELCSCASLALGIKWLQSDPQFAVLMSSLASGRLIIAFEDYPEIKIEQLIVCLSLLEDLIQCVEDDESDFLNEQSATLISKSEQEAASFVCECIVKLYEEPEVSGRAECLMALERYLSAFLAIGGEKIIDEKILGPALNYTTKE